MGKRFVKAHRSTVERRTELPILRHAQAGGIPGVAVKCVDIGRNTEGEGSLLGLF